MSLVSFIPETIAVIRKFVRLIRREPFDTSLESGRQDERHRAVLINVAAGLFGKLATVAANLLVVPILLSYLGDARFGVWTTITSFVMLLSFSDLGIGNGLMTAISQAAGRDDRDEMRRLTTAGFATTLAVGCLLALIAVLTCPFVPWERLLNLPVGGGREVADSMSVLGVFLGIAMPANVAARVETGLQRGFVSSILQIIGAALSLVLTLVAVHLKADLSWIVGVAVGAPVTVAVVNSIGFFAKRRIDLRPGFAYLSRSTIRTLLKMGLLFFALQLTLSIGMWSDNLIVSRLLGPEAVTQYAVPARLFGLIPLLVILVTGPLWPAYGEALSRGDRLWARRTLTRTMTLSVLGATSAAIVLSVVLQPILDVWVSGRINPSVFLITALALAAIVESWRTSVVMFLNGRAVVGLQIAVDTSFSIVCIAIRISLVTTIGLAGIPIGAFLAFCVTTLAPYALYLRNQYRTTLEMS